MIDLCDDDITLKSFCGHKLMPLLQVTYARSKEGKRSLRQNIGLAAHSERFNATTLIFTTAHHSLIDDNTAKMTGQRLLYRRRNPYVPKKPMKLRFEDDKISTTFFDGMHRIQDQRLTCGI